MTDPATPDDRRAQHVAALGFVLQLVSCGALWGLSYWSKSDAIASVTRLIVIGLPIWLILFLVFKQMRRVSAEALEVAELKRAREAGSADAIFELDDEALLLEQNRLRWMARWMLPSVTVVLAAFLLVGHLVGWGWVLEEAFAKDGLRRTQEPTMTMWFVVGIGFLCFLYARYSTALARLPQWRLIRAGATCMAGNAFACLGLAIVLMATGTIEWAEPLFAYIVRVALLVLGIEFAMNFVLDLYRPRIPGEIPRPSFDSRLLGLITEPGGFAKSIADAMNYQFGFEVSRTWFYQLLQRWMLPIVAVTVVAILALTSIVVVEADEQVVVERFGRRVQEPPEALSPGLHLKWPYPIDVVYRAPVKRVSELVVGEATEEDDQDPRRAIVWTEQHQYIPELMLLVASPKLASLSPDEAATETSSDASESVAVSLLMVSVPIEYRIKDIHKYLYTSEDPVKLMEVVAYQYLSDYAAGVDIDELIGPGREKFNQELRMLLQGRLDALDVGVEIAFVGVRGAHPPAEKQVAATFQKVVSAETSMAATINAANGEARKVLTAVAGTEARAKALDKMIQAKDRLREDPSASAAELAEVEQAVEDLLIGNPAKGIAPLSGRAAALIADARARSTRRVSEVASKVRAFGAEVAAYKAAPELYMQRKWLEVFEQIGPIRKFLIVGDPSNVIIVYETRKDTSLDQVLADGVGEERK
jgi:membrane protease subunit HflK